MCAVGFQLEPDQQGFGAAVLSGVTCPSPRGRRGIPIPVSYFPGEYSHHQATGQLRVVSLPSLLPCQEKSKLSVPKKQGERKHDVSVKWLGLF